MDKEQFWQVIDKARQEAGSWKEMYGPLRDSLSQLPPHDILRWHLILDEYMNLSHKEKLWGAADIVMNGGGMENDFENFQRWLISQGKKVFMDALADPGSLAGVEAVRFLSREDADPRNASPGWRRGALSFEGLQNVAADAYESKPGTGDFYDALYDTEIADSERADMALEILYAKDIDTEPGGRNAAMYERMAALRRTFPALYGLFNDASAPLIQNYDFIHTIRIGGADVIFAENKAASEPYMVCERTWNNPLGADEFKNAVIGDDFLAMMRVFSDRLSGRVAELEEEWDARGIPFEKLTAADCVPDGLSGNLEGKVCVLKPEKLAPEFRTIDYQLVLVTGGFGAVPNARGRKVFCTDLYTGKQETFNRDAIAGVLSPERLPDWAREKLAALQKPAERESIVGKLREGKNTPPRDPKPKSHKKDRPER